MKKSALLLKNQNGYALFIVLLTLSLISILGLTLLSTTSNSLNTSSKERDSQALYYIAESGIVLKKAKIEETVYDEYRLINSYSQCLSNTLSAAEKFSCKQRTFIARVKNRVLPLQSTTTYEHFKQQFGKWPKADVQTKKVTETPTQLVYNITSTGSLKEKNSRSRTLSQVITISLTGTPGVDTGDGSDNGSSSSLIWETTPVISNYAVYSYETISLSGGATVIGKVCSSTGAFSTSGGATVTGGICSSKDTGYIQLPDKSKLLPEFPTATFTTLNQLPYPANVEVVKDPHNKTLVINNGNFTATSWITNNYTFNVTKDMKLNTFTIDSNNQITLDIGNSSKNIYVNDFTIKQGSLNVVGNGELNLYVRNNFDVKGFFNRVGSNIKVNIFYAGTPEIKLTNETQVMANLYSKTADLSFAGGSGFNGNIYSGGQSISISGGISSTGQFIIAPNANISLSGGGQLKGTIISNTLVASGGTSITFSNEFIKQPPPQGNITPPPIIGDNVDEANLIISDRIVEE